MNETSSLRCAAATVLMRIPRRLDRMLRKLDAFDRLGAHRRQGRRRAAMPRRRRGPRARRPRSAASRRARRSPGSCPRGRSIPRERPQAPGSPLAPPFPDLLDRLRAGGRCPICAHVKRASGGAPSRSSSRTPGPGAGTADLIWVPEHDRLRGANVHRHPDPAASGLRRRASRPRARRPDPRLAALPGPASRCSPAATAATTASPDADVDRFVRRPGAACGNRRRA